MAAIWDRLQSLVFGAAVGRAGSEAVTPVLEPVRQKSWLRNTVRVLDTRTAADLIAKGFATVDQLRDEAARNGYNAVRLEALAQLAQTYPGRGELDTMSNRELIPPELVDKALSRHGIPGEYHAAIKASFRDLLSPGELAAAIHRGLVPDPGLLKGEQPEPPFNVEAYPVYPIDPVKEAGGSGLDRDRLGVLVGLQGLPMGVIEAAHAFYRKIITYGDYIRAFNESNNRNEWAQAVLEYARQIPTARDFMENALRGHHDFDWAAEQAERHGMTRDDAFLIYQNQGRPLNLHQITQAKAWGANYNPGQGDNADPWMQAVLLGAVRPEYYEMQDSLKYNLPSALYFRTLQQSGVLSPEQAEVWYKRLGWPPDLAHQVAQAYAKPRGAAAKEATASDLLTLYDGRKATRAETLTALEALDYPADEAATKLDVIDARRVASARSTAISDLHAAFKKRDLSQAQATAALTALGIAGWAVPEIVGAWQAYLDAFPPEAPPVPAA
jgi:hypothetical protein